MKLADATAREKVETQAKATRKEEFDTLFGLLKDHYAGLIDFQFKHGTILTLILGWVISSGNTREFLRVNPIIAVLGFCGFVLYAAFHSGWVWNFYQRSRTAYKQLHALDYMESEYLKPRRVQLSTAVSFMILHWFVVLLLGGVILFSRP